MGAAVQEIRRTAGLNQAQAAAQIESSRPTLSRMERGEPVMVDVLFSLVSALGYELVLVPRGARVRVDADQERP